MRAFSNRCPRFFVRSPGSRAYIDAMVHPVLAPYEVTWEPLLLEGIHAQFHNPHAPLEVEIGPGDDGFLARRATQVPERNWLGIEYSHKRVRRYVRRLERLDVAGASHWKNVRLVWRPARDVIAEFLSPAQVDTYHIYFPDPWPKAHHARYRLLQPAFLHDVGESLAPDGRVFIATDSHRYAEGVLEAVASVPTLENLVPSRGIARRPLGDHMTAFEAQWREMGRSIFALELGRV